MKINKYKVAKAAKIGVLQTWFTLMCAVWLLPIIWILLHAFRQSPSGNVTYFWPRNWTIDNFVNLFDTPGMDFGLWFGNTLLVAVLTAILTTLIIMTTAYVLSRYRFRLRKSYMKLALILGMFPGFLGMLVIWNMIVVFEFPPLIMLSIVYSSLAGLGFFIAKGFFDTIPRSLDEAAMIDGASRSRVFFRIILPLSKPIIVYTVIMAFLAPWADFMLVRFVVPSSQYWTVSVGLHNMISEQSIGQYFTMFCAGAVLVGLPTSLLFMLMQRYYVSGLTSGAAKG
jgi:arabinogalactan oligomer/maltooligosaccharide transport system permease protein